MSDITPDPDPARDSQADGGQCRDDQRGRLLDGPCTAGITPASPDPRMLAAGELGAAEVAALCWLDPDFEPGHGGECEDSGGELAAEEDEPPAHTSRYEFAIAVGGSPVECRELLPAARRRGAAGR